MSITKGVLSDRFDNVLDGDFDRSQFRLSNTGKCRRMRMMKVLSYEAMEKPQETAEYFERGNVLEDWFVDQITAKYPRKTRKQIEVHTPFGDIGHMDIWFPNPPDKPATIIEIKSVSEKARYYLPNDDHIDQVQAYMHFFTNSRGYRRADRAEIIYIFFGRKLETQTYTINYDELKGKRIEKELKMLHRWKNEGHVPDIPSDMSPDSFPCFWRTTDNATGHCDYYKHCWGASEKKEDTIDFTGDKPLEELIEKYANLKEDYSRVNKRKKQIKKKKKDLEEAIGLALDVRDTDKAIVNEKRIKRTKTGGRVYWKPERALKQGLIDKETLEKIKQASDKSSGYTRYYLKNVGDKK